MIPMNDPEVSWRGLEDLAQLDDIGLRQRWRRLMGRPMPVGLGRALILRLLAYQAQVRLYGDLELASRRALAEALGRKQRGDSPADVSNAAAASAAGRSGIESSPLPRPGTLLTREYGGLMHRVMVTDQGFGWNGKTFDSLSKVALAITGTRWNGPRFFGLRDKVEHRAAKCLRAATPSKQSAVRGPLGGLSSAGTTRETAT